MEIKKKENYTRPAMTVIDIQPVQLLDASSFNKYDDKDYNDEGLEIY